MYHLEGVLSGYTYISDYVIRILRNQKGYKKYIFQYITLKKIK